MSLLELLGLGAPARRASSPLAAEIGARLGRLAPARAELVAAFAGLLVRVAHADRQVSAAERSALHRLVAEQAGLAAEEAAIVADIVIEHATAAFDLNYAALTRTFNERATLEDKERLIDCLYAVAAAESSVSIAEDDEIRAVANALLLSHGQFIAIRQRYRDRLEVLQGLRPPRGS